MENVNFQPLIVLVILIGALVIAISIGVAKSNESKKLEAELANRELAIIIEHVRPTAGGGICLFLLIAAVIGSLFAFGFATTVFQQIEAGVSLIAGAILFGGGVAIGRARSYRVYRSEHRETG